MNNWGIDRSWSLFLDRDGVINERNFEGYITSTKDFIFREKVLESLATFNAVFGNIFIVTNQQCIAKGILSEIQLDEIHEYMLSQIHNSGGRIDSIYIAKEKKGEEPFHRKPSPTMALMAKDDFPNIEFSKSIMVGDTDTDIEFGKNLGMKTALVYSDEVTNSSPDVNIKCLSELCAFI